MAVTGIEVPQSLPDMLALIRAADDHYQEAAAAFSRHRMLVSEAANIASTLKIQRVIFRAANRTLLAHCVGEELAAQMLDNRGHSLWADKSLELELRKWLGDSVDVTTESVKLIEDQLKRLDKHRHTLERLELEARKAGLPFLGLLGDTNVKGTCKVVRRKLKSAYTQISFQEILDRLRNLTQDFRVVIEQRAAIGDRRKPESKLGEVLDKSIVHFRMVQAAAKDLHAVVSTALSLACLDYSECQVYLGIQPSQNGASPEFRFGIGSFNIVDSIGIRNDPLWLKAQVLTAAVQSKDPEKVAVFEESLIRKTVLERPLHQVPAKRAKKTVRFMSPSPSWDGTAAQHDELSLKTHSLLRDVDVCSEPQRSHVSSKSEAARCIGVLAHTAGSRYLLSFDSHEDTFPPNPESKPLKFISLASLFATSQGANKAARLSFFDRVRLARLLATAVLQFHATPWLKHTLCSKDVFFHSVDSSIIKTISVQNEVYLNTAIRGPDCPALRGSPFRSPPRVRNQQLFALGVILIELAYEAPLHSLQKPTDVASHDDQNTDYYIADRVRLTVSSMLGPMYADLIRKCIHCDFGRGNNLEDPALQESFYVEVVQGLEELEAKFHSFGLGG